MARMILRVFPAPPDLRSIQITPEFTHLDLSKTGRDQAVLDLSTLVCTRLPPNIPILRLDCVKHSAGCEGQPSFAWYDGSNIRFYCGSVNQDDLDIVVKSCAKTISQYHYHGGKLEPLVTIPLLWH